LSASLALQRITLGAKTVQRTLFDP
jgi:hypothetical protein